MHRRRRPFALDLFSRTPLWRSAAAVAAATAEFGAGLYKIVYIVLGNFLVRFDEGKHGDVRVDYRLFF